MGTYLAQQDDFEQGVPMVNKAIALNPHPPGWIMMTSFYDHYRHGRYEEALATTKGLELGPDFRAPLFVAATLGQLGRRDEAKSELEELRALWARPVSELRSELNQRHAFSAEFADHLMEGLAKAGLALESSHSHPQGYWRVRGPVATLAEVSAGRG